MRKEPVVKNSTTYVGLDVHKDSIHVSMLGAGQEPLAAWKQANTAGVGRRLGRKLKRVAGGEVVCCYEAGPCGYVVQRELAKEGIRCLVVAPSLIPVKPGERVKTDKRDARKLAEHLRAGLLTEVHPPTPEQEAVRDLCRCRQDARADLLRCRHRLGKFLLRRGLVRREGRNWTQAHRLWLRKLRFDHEAERAVFDDYLLAVEQLEERVRTIGQALAAAAEQEPYREQAGWLRCFRGIDTVTAMTILAELHGVERFATARALMAYLGLTPSEYSSSDKQRRGAITKAGNVHLRRVLVEAAWHYRHAPREGVKLRQRRKGQPAWVVQVSKRAERRLHRRLWTLITKGNKPPQKATVAVARELVGFIWAVLNRTAEVPA
jgi:transposase